MLQSVCVSRSAWFVTGCLGTCVLQDQARAQAELMRRQEELERKAAELDRREREMQSLNASGGVNYNGHMSHMQSLRFLQNN